MIFQGYDDGKIPLVLNTVGLAEKKNSVLECDSIFI